MKFIAKIIIVLTFYIFITILVLIGCLWHLSFSLIERECKRNFIDVFDESEIRRLDFGDRYFVYKTGFDWIIGKKTYITK